MFFEIKNYQSLRLAMDALCEHLASCAVSPERIFDSRLAVNELVGNELRHSEGWARLNGEVKDGFVELSVYGSAQFIPPRESRCPEVFSESGRGLFLVDSVCSERVFTEDGAILVRIKIK